MESSLETENEVVEFESNFTSFDFTQMSIKLLVNLLFIKLYAQNAISKDFDVFAENR